LIDLSSFTYIIKTKTARRVDYVIQDSDRFGAKSRLEKIVQDAGFEYKDGVKSSTSIDIRTLDVIFENITHRFYFKPKSGGSGAGAEITALGECFQAYACAARQKKGSDLETAEEAIDLLDTSIIKQFTDCDRTLEQCVKGLDPDWLNSGVVIANKFASKLGSSKYKFLRGGSIVDSIEKTYNKLKKESGITLNINKWNPSDIWAIKVNFKPKFDHDTLDQYNKYILSEFNNKNLIGVSLKKLTSGANRCKEELFNGGIPRPEAKFVSYSIAGKRGNDPWSKIYKDKPQSASKDAYLTYTVGGKKTEMQIRTFTNGKSGWQGEIKGASAAGGKIGGGNLQEALKLAGVPSSKFEDQTSFKSKSSINNKNTIKKFTEMYNKLSKDKVTVDEMTIFLSNYNDNWLYSKYLTMQFIYVMINERKEDNVMAMLDSIASSSTPKSSVFLKYS
jgi:hypothetical protein